MENIIGRITRRGPDSLGFIVISLSLSSYFLFITSFNNPRVNWCDVFPFSNDRYNSQKGTNGVLVFELMERILQ